MIALVCALASGVVLGALAGTPAPGTASAARRVVVMTPPPVAAPLPANASLAGLAALQAVPAPPPALTPPPPAPPPAPPPPPTPAPARSSPPRTSKAPPRPAKRKPKVAGTHTGAGAEDVPAPIKHVVVVTLADKGFEEAFGRGSKAPYLATQLRGQGLLLRRYYATAHGGLPNLIGLLSGQASNPDIASGCAARTPFAVSAKPTADGQVRGAGCVLPASVATLPAQLEAKRLTWRVYAEGADPAAGTPPGPCPPPAPAADGSPAAVDRSPWLFFAAIAGAADCTAKVTGLGALAADVAAAPAQAPALSIVLPGACDAGREGACPAGEPDGLVRADGWLSAWLPRLLAAPSYSDDTMIVITFDQARSTGPRSDFASCCGQLRGVNEPASADPQAPVEGGGRVGALVLSPHVKAGGSSDVPYNHFALLRTIERAFGLDLLGLAGADELRSFGADVFGGQAAG